MVEGAQELKGTVAPPSVVVLERGPVDIFATAVTDDNPVFHDRRAARVAGFDDVPVPPTFPFAWSTWGRFPEIQPEGASADSPITQAIGTLRGRGGLILHGEQEFVYHRTPVVGETLRSEGEITDVYTKEGRSTMTFVVTETTWFDAQDEPVVTAVMTLLHKA